jgi:hypothetical protein
VAVAKLQSRAGVPPAAGIVVMSDRLAITL